MTWLEHLACDFFLGCAIEVVTRRQETRDTYLASLVLALYDDGPFGEDARRKLPLLAERFDDGLLGAQIRAARAAAEQSMRHARWLAAQAFPPGAMAKLYGVPFDE